MQREKSKDINARSKSDIKARAYYFALKVIKLVDALPNQKSSRIISDQLLRSATSIGANIIESQAASSKKDFVNFLSYSLKSANETKFWLGLLRDSGKIDREIINEYLTEVTEFSNILGASILTVKGKRNI